MLEVLLTHIVIRICRLIIKVAKTKKKTRKKGKCLDKTSTQTLQQLRYSLFKYSLGLLIFKQFSKVFFLYFSRY